MTGSAPPKAQALWLCSLAHAPAALLKFGDTYVRTSAPRRPFLARDRDMAAPAAEVEMGAAGALLEGDAGGSGSGGRRRKPLGWRCMPFIIATETFEKVGSVGVAANLTVYLVKSYNIGQLAAANITNIFYGTLNFTPLLGAFISDAYLGRFRTLSYGSFFSLLGMLGLTLSASVPALKPPGCSQTA